MYFNHVSTNKKTKLALRRRALLQAERCFIMLWRLERYSSQTSFVRTAVEHRSLWNSKCNVPQKYVDL